MSHTYIEMVEILNYTVPLFGVGCRVYVRMSHVTHTHTHTHTHMEEISDNIALLPGVGYRVWGLGVNRSCHTHTQHGRNVGLHSVNESCHTHTHTHTWQKC